MKIVVLDGYTLNPGDISWQPLENLGDLTVYDRTAPRQIIKRVGDAEIVFTNKTCLTEKQLAKMPQLKYIGVLATGYNVVDVNYAHEKGITVTNIPSYGTQAVAQMTFALLLEMCNHVQSHSEQVKNGAWCACKDFCFWSFPLMELAGKTMGIIGFGRIGQAVAKVALALGMKVLVATRSPKSGPGICKSEDLSFTDRETVFSQSDIISLHCPLTEETKEMIDRDSIALMKKEALLINTSRGGLINEKDLAQALHDERIAGAALDVLSGEPPKGDNLLLFEQNCMITPHIAWAAKECRIRLMNIAAENLQNFLVGTPIHTV